MAVEVSQGVCDLCGAPSDASLQECNWLTCTFQHCEGGLYHQECLEKYLRQSKLEKNRKTGFKCPRGCGKGTKFDTPCPGRIDKSHPIHPRNEDKKKTKLAAVVVEPPRPAKPAAPVAQNGKSAKAKDDAKAEASKEGKNATAAAKVAPAAKASSPGTATLSPGTQKAAAAAKKETAALPPRPEVVQKQKLAELAAQARRELGLPTASLSGSSTHSSKGDLQVLAGASAGPSKSGGGATPSAWGKPVASAEPPAASPQPPMMSQLPQLQQLYQAASKKPAVKTAAAPAPAALAAKPAPAVPQPVLNPPTPVWPALGSTQASAAALLASTASSGGSGQTPREAATARPPSPPSVWGPAAATQPSVPLSTQLSQQAPTPAPAVASRPLPSVGSSGALSSTSTAGAASPLTTAAAASPSPVGAEAVLREGITIVTGGPEPSTSGRGSVADGLDGAGAAASSLSAATSSQSLSTAAQQAGSEAGEEEVKEPKLTKAQKKNLKRLEKKKGPQSSAAQQEAPQEAQAAAASAPPASARQANTTAESGAAASSAAAAAADGSVRERRESRASEEPERAHAAEVEAEAPPPLEELCFRGIVAQKVLSLVAKLQRLGAPEVVAAAAVQRHGSDMHAALEWLLVAGAEAASAPPEAVLTAAAGSASAAEAEVDIAPELHQLSELQAAMGVPAELLYQCVVDCDGDVAAAANSAMQRVLAAAPAAAAPGGGPQAAAASAPRPGGRLSESTADPLAVAVGSSTQLPASASYYSISSLDTATSCLDHDQAKQQPQQQQQQPVYSNHFGVRLVDEPVGGSGGYEGADTYAAGLLRGGVVLGAAGWPNGYLRDSPPQPAANGRSTSRLLHWLRDGRAAALEEEAGACNGPLSGADPVVESPFSAHGDASRRQTASASPSLNNWLGSNGFHPPQHAPVAATTAGRADSQDMFSAANSGAFSFASAGSKPSAADYGSRWGSHAAPRQEASAAAAGSSAVGATEAESAPHNDGDNDIHSIMALINIR